jgi:hypothetical protein
MDRRAETAIGERAIAFNASRQKAIEGLTQAGIDCANGTIPDMNLEDRAANPIQAAIYNYEVIRDHVNPVVNDYFTLRPTARVSWHRNFFKEFFGDIVGEVVYSGEGMQYRFINHAGAGETREFGEAYIRRLWDPQDIMNRKKYRTVVRMFGGDSVPQLIQRFAQTVR